MAKKKLIDLDNELLKMDNMDTEKIMEYINEMESESEIQIPDYKNIRNKLFNKKSEKNISFFRKRNVWVASIICILLLSTTVAAVSGLLPLKEWFSTKESDTIMTKDMVSFSSIDEALAQIERGVVYPDDIQNFSFSNALIHDFGKFTSLDLVYKNAEKSLLYSIIYDYESDNELKHILRKSDFSITVNGIEILYVEKNGILTATFEKESIYYYITGNIGVNELENIINGLK